MPASNPDSATSQGCDSCSHVQQVTVVTAVRGKLHYIRKALGSGAWYPGAWYPEQSHYQRRNLSLRTVVKTGACSGGNSRRNDQHLSLSVHLSGVSATHKSKTKTAFHWGKGFDEARISVVAFPSDSCLQNLTCVQRRQKKCREPT